MLQTLWKKVKILVTTISSFSNNAFQNSYSQLEARIV